LQDIGLFAVAESQCTEDEHDDEDEDDSTSKITSIPAVWSAEDMTDSKRGTWTVPNTRQP
jgi:hypothetical protein